MSVHYSIQQVKKCTVLGLQSVGGDGMHSLKSVTDSSQYHPQCGKVEAGAAGDIQSTVGLQTTSQNL